MVNCSHEYGHPCRFWLVEWMVCFFMQFDEVYHGHLRGIVNQKGLALLNRDQGDDWTPKQLNHLKPIAALGLLLCSRTVTAPAQRATLCPLSHLWHPAPWPDSSQPQGTAAWKGWITRGDLRGRGWNRAKERRIEWTTYCRGNDWGTREIEEHRK